MEDMGIREQLNLHSRQDQFSGNVNPRGIFEQKLGT